MFTSLLACLIIIQHIDSYVLVSDQYNNTNITTIKAKFDGNQLWKTKMSTTTNIEYLQKMERNNEIEIWGVRNGSADIMVKAPFLNTTRANLDRQQIEYQVTIDDLQEAIDGENPSIELSLDNRKGHQLTWNSYHKLSDIYGFLDYLAGTYPDLCKLDVIGNSVNGLPIKLLKISNNNPENRAVFLDGGIHAREWISPAAVTYIINQFVTNWTDQSVSIRKIDWYIIPIANPDGYDYTFTTNRLWRKNRSKYGECYGVDLNRNFRYKWGGDGASTSTCSQHYRGPSPFSEPETAAIAKFFKNHPKIKWTGFVSMHSYGQYLVYPWAYSKVILEDHQELERVALKAAYRIVLAGGVAYTVGPAAMTIYSASGSSLDWAKGELGIKYVYTIELRDTGRYGFLLPARYIIINAKEAVIALKIIADAASVA